MIPSAVPGDHHTTTAPEAAVTSLTDHDIAILAARLTDPNVTALPWVTDSFEIYQAHPTGIENMGVWVAESCNVDLPDSGSANAALIVAAVNALPDLLAEVKRLRQELADTAQMCDFHARSATHLAGKRDNAEAAIAAWEQGRSTGYDALLRIKTALASPAPATCTCGAEPAHQHGCPAGQ